MVSSNESDVPSEEFKAEAVKVLQKIYLFRGLDESECRIILDVCKLIRYRDRKLIFSEGDFCNYFLVVVSGQIDILTSKKGCISALLQGEVLGEMGVLLNHTRSASAMSMGDSVLLKIRKDDFRGLRKKEPRVMAILMHNVAHSLAERISVLNKKGD